MYVVHVSVDMYVCMYVYTLKLVQTTTSLKRPLQITQCYSMYILP